MLIFSIISTLCVLIVYIKIMKKFSLKSDLFKERIRIIMKNSQTLNKNGKFIYEYLTAAKCNLTDVNSQFQIDSIILLKLLEFNFFVKYNKSIETKYEKRKFLNCSDFLIKGLFYFEKTYDLMNSTNKNFNNKSVWNFCESLKITYESFPKIIKQTLVRHLKYLPNNDNLLYNLIQYYYLNKNKRNCKILIKKILAKDNNVTAMEETICLILMMLININLNYENYGVYI